MVYPKSFYRIVIGGTLYTESWNTSLQVYAADDQPVTPELLAAVADSVEDFHVDGNVAGGQFHSQAFLTYVKVNRINALGHYQDPVSMTHDYPVPRGGGGAGTGVPPQIATVASLRTDFERGLAHRGRMYLVPAMGFTTPATDGRAPAASALRVAGAVSTLINRVNTDFATVNGGDFGGRVAIISNKGAGAFHFVTRVECGRVIDTMRSRRSSLDEDHQISPIPIAGA